jgi:PDZ domain-containing protein
LGIFVASVPEIPLDIEIDAGNVSGPSGGQIFALAIYDLLTPGSLTGGKHIAGTGTIDVDGSIGPIGGVRQKLVGAKNAGAEYFLIPESNCSDAKGNIPAGIKVIAVSNLKQSLKAIESIRSGSTGVLPGCN